MNSFSPCNTIRQWDKQRKGCRELLIVYGGMCANEVAFLVEHMTPGSRVFWLEKDLPESSAELDLATESGVLGISGADEKALAVFFDLYDPKSGLNIVLLNAERASSGDQDQCTERLRAIQETMRIHTFSTGTLVINGPTWQRNTLRNLPRILTNPGTNVLHDQFKDKPALVIGAGPSLNDAIPFLKNLQDQFVIISTGTALAPLRKAGIKPDLVMAVDASHLVEKQFTVPCEDLFFVGATIVCPQVPGRFKGEFYSLLDSNPIDQWVKSISETEGRLMAGGTVTACGMHLANLMGCNPVVTVGLDLAYANDGCSHASGTMYHGRKVEQNHLNPVPGNWVETVYTTRQFSCYIDLIKNYVRDMPHIRFVNVTNGGARIGVMEVYKVDQLPALAGDAFNAYEMIEQLHGSNVPSSTGLAQEDLNGVMTYLDEVQQLCRAGAMASNRLMLMKRFPERADPVEMKACLDELIRIDERLENGDTTYDFLQMSLWPAAFELGSQAQQDTDKSGRNNCALGRSRKFYEQMAGSARWTKELILQCCSILGQRAA